MYGWVDDTSKWAGTGGYSFGAARAKYDKAAVTAGVTGTRTYKGKNEPDMKLVDPRGKTITSDSTDPVIIAVDVTGSMASWPAGIFDRLPLLCKTLGKYREGADLAFAAIGDATCDRYPLQVTNFANKITELEANLNGLGCEGGGGGQISESYELFGYFMQNRCETPKATSPFLLIYGDEKFYPKVDSKQVKHFIGDTLEKAVESSEIWRGLMQKFNVYYLHKPYGEGSDTSTTKEVGEYWANILGRQRVIELPTEERAVDIALGLIAKQWGEYDDFSKSLGARHSDPKTKASVHHSLRHIDADPPVVSVTKGAKGSRMTKALI